MKTMPVASVMRCLSSGALALSVAFVAAVPAAAGNALTYSATLGAARSDDEIELLATVTTNVEMTVTLYPDGSGDYPLWCRRFAADVVEGCFAVILEDTNGTDVSLTELPHPASFGTLDSLFAGREPSDEIWVEVSNVRAGGQPLAGVASTLPRGKITAAPFAVVAERAEGSRSSFCVRGTATVAGLESIGDFRVDETASFSDAVTFNRQATFLNGGLSVTGTVSKANLGGIGTLTAESLVAEERPEVGSVVITNGASTTLSSSATGYDASREFRIGEIRVAGTFDVGGTLTATGLTNDALEVTGTFTLPKDGKLDWDSDGTLSVPDGVYEADDENRQLVGVYKTGETDCANATGKPVLLTYVVGSGGKASASGVGKISGQEWVCYGGASSVGIDLTTLFPMKAGETASASMVLTEYMKELSK